MKVVIKLLILLGLITYLGFAITKFCKPYNQNICKQLNIYILDSTKASFVSKKDIVNILTRNNINPVGERMRRINLTNIEELLRKQHFILDAECYKSTDDELNIEILQRLPIMRIISHNGENYYIDAQGNEIPNINYSADVIIVTGYVSKNYAKKHLLTLGKLLQTDVFWDSQIEQIYIEPNGEMKIIPRVGNHVVLLGKPHDIQNKLKKLKFFYNNVLSQVGWNKYTKIDMQFSNQIVCTKE